MKVKGREVQKEEGLKGEGVEGLKGSMFKDVRLYPIVAFWPFCPTFHNVNNDGQSIFGRRKRDH